MSILTITCSQLEPFMKILSYLMRMIKIIVPIVLILLIIIDMTKAVAANDEKTIINAKQLAVKRFLYAILLFLVPTLVLLIFKTLGNTLPGDELANPTDWIKCYNQFR